MRSPLGRRVARAVAPAVFLGATLVATPASAGSHGYFVAYTHHMEEGETEVMLMTDLNRPSAPEDGVGTHLAQMLEIERGFGRKWAAELMLEGYFDTTYGSGRFTGFRLEGRYRLHAAEGGLNPVLYVEYEHLHPETRYKMELSGRLDGMGEPGGLEGRPERILESRLILSRDVGRWNVAFNWINETDLRRGGFGFTDFGYALGLQRSLGPGHHDHAGEEGGASGRGSRPWKPVAVGVELYGGVGNSKAFGLTWAQEHYLQPLAVFHPAEGVMLHVGVAIGLTGPSDTLLRTAIAFEF